jgi:multiple sugar transport system substrate-binding protein
MVPTDSISRREVLGLGSSIGLLSLTGCISSLPGQGGDSDQTGGPAGTLGEWSLDINSPDQVTKRINGAEWMPPAYDENAVASDFQHMNLGAMKNDPATAWWHDYFNQNTGMSTESVIVPSTDAVSKMRTLLSSGSSSPAVLQISQEFLLSFVAQGWLEPVDELWTDEVYESFPPYFKDEATTGVDPSIEGEHTYVSVGIAEGHGLNYNPAVLEELGFPADFYAKPTWSDVREVCEEAKSREGYYGWVWYGKGNRYPVYPWLRQTWSRGGDIVRDDGRVVVNGDASVATVEWQQQMIEENLVPDPLQYATGGPADLYLGEGLAGFVGGLGMIGLLRKQWGDDFTEQYDVGLPPKSPNGERISYMNTDFLTINRAAPPDKKRAAMVYMDGARSAIASAHEYDMEGNFPTNLNAWELDLLDDAKFKEKAQQIGDIAEAELWPNQIETFTVLISHLQAAWLGKESPQAALDAAQSEIDEIMGQN